MPKCGLNIIIGQNVTTSFPRQKAANQYCHPILPSTSRKHSGHPAQALSLLTSVSTSLCAQSLLFRAVISTSNAIKLCHRKFSCCAATTGCCDIARRDEVNFLMVSRIITILGRTSSTKFMTCSSQPCAPGRRSRWLYQSALRGLVRPNLKL
jgi:hypothetical protein